MRRMLVGTVVVFVSALVVAVSAQQAPVKTEADYDALMKKLDDAFQGARKSLDAKSAPEAAKHAAALVDALQKAEGFWKLHKKDDAVGWAQATLTGAQAIQKAAAAGDVESASKAWTDTRPTCRTCHMAYRSKQDDGTFIIKAGTIGK